MINTVNLSSLDLQLVVAKWLREFDASIQRNDETAITALFQPDGHWRDLLAFSWHIITMNGADEIKNAFKLTITTARPSNFQIAKERTPPRIVTRAGKETIEAIVAFETTIGKASGVLRLVPAQNNSRKMVAWVLLTSLDSITGHDECNGPNRPSGQAYSKEFGGDNWLDKRLKGQRYDNHDPTVLVIGGGQAGLGIAACLGQHRIDTLVIDRHERVGDAWRKRYHSLTLHNEVHINHMPYLPFPSNYPVFIPKDKVANWFEFYAEVMEINYWTETNITSGTYDELEGKWKIYLSRKDGSSHLLRPSHIIFATGVSAIPIRPEIPGLDSFKGSIIHSSEYITGHTWKGLKTLVIGTGNSGHDIAQDLHASGADVTIIQRNSTLVVSLEQAQTVYSMYTEGPPLEDCDLIATATPYPILVKGYQIAAKAMQKADKQLLDDLASRGFKLDNGPPDNTGYQMKYLRRGGGYYFNVGCSDLIVNGKISLIQYKNIEKFISEGVLMKDGNQIKADLLVTATGYKNQQDVVRLYLGDEIANRVGKVWGFDDFGEQRNMWRRTRQPGLWFTAGGLPHVRIYSKYLALQIKAIELGLIKPIFPSDQIEGIYQNSVKSLINLETA